MKPFYLRFTLLFYLVLNLFLVKAQKPRLVFHQITPKEGLSESTIRGIVEDARGFMWFASEDGLNKFDGYKFTVYKNLVSDTFSISNNSNKSLLNDSKGNLWIVTKNGLNIYDHIHDRFYNYRSPEHKGLHPLKSDIEAIAEDCKGHIWVAAGIAGLYEIENLHKSPHNYPFQSTDNSNIFISVMPYSDGTILVGTRDGLLKFDTNKKEYIDLRNLYGRGYHVRSIYIDKNNNIWLCTTQGLKIIDAVTGRMKEYMHLPDDIYSINGDNTIGVVPYGDNTYLIAIDGYGIDYFNSKREKFLHYSFGDESQLNSNNITALLIDSRKEIWAGTFLNGINYSNHSTNLFSLVHNNRYSSEFIRQGIITDFLKDKNENFWIATDGGGLYLKEKNKDSFFNFVPGVKENTIPGRAVIKMEEDDDGIWLTTYAGGLAKYNSRSRSFKVYKHNPEDPNSVVSNKLNVITTYNGKLWISSYGTGISVLDKHTGKFKNYRSILNDSTSLPSEWVQVFFRDSDNVLWLGTSNGLSRYIPEKDCFKTYYFDKGTSVAEKNSIIDIVIDSKGNFWLGTGGAGIILFDRHKESFEFYTTSDGLSSNNVKSIIEDNYSNLWIATNNGITRFEINSRTGKPYTIEDGVPAAAFFSNSKYKADDGNIYFGTNNGYLVIDPLHAKKNEHVPPVYLTDLKIFNESVLPSDSNSILKESINHTKSVSLTYDKNALTLEFSALNYNNPLKNQYEYILEGFEENWIHAGNRRTVTYTNLDPGTYHFKCKGSNNDLVWNASPASLEIIILPPWWKTWWCISIEIAMLLLLLYSIYRWRINNIRKHNQLLEETISQRTKELEESNEQLEAFVYKASHDIKGPLRSIIGLTTVGQKDVSDETALVYFQHILSSTKKLDKLLVDLLQVAKVKQASVNNEKIIFDELVTDAISKFKHLPGFDNIQVNTLIDEKAPFYSDKHLMYSIIQNLVENPIKYQDPMKAKPFLNIEIETTKRQALLKFTDNGLGIPKDYHSKVFEMFFKVDEVSQGTGLGLYIVKTTVEKLGGKISMTSKHGEGTTFTINISNSPEKNL